jgi:hypothetical protein
MNRRDFFRATGAIAVGSIVGGMTVAEAVAENERLQAAERAFDKGGALIMLHYAQIEEQQRQEHESFELAAQRLYEEWWASLQAKIGNLENA